jgi:hypothetical protein
MTPTSWAPYLKNRLPTGRQCPLMLARKKLAAGCSLEYAARFAQMSARDLDKALWEAIGKLPGDGSSIVTSPLPRSGGQ